LLDLKILWREALRLDVELDIENVSALPRECADEK
jgi:hypothetical protein